MKKVLAGLITAALVLSLSTTGALAAPHHGRAVERICSGVQAGRLCYGLGFVDTDGDGVCDNYGPEICPGNGMGSGNGWGHGMGRGCHGRRGC